MSLTGSQRDIVDSLAVGSIVLVKAGPGTGKTRVFCAAIKSAATALGPETHRSVAALSFTNAAADEYARRIGVEVSPRHFIGTLDSFLLRFIVMPFGRALVKCGKPLHLLPDPLDKHFDAGVVQVSANGRDRVPLNVCTLTGGSIDEPGVRVPRPGGGYRDLAPEYAAAVFRKKKLLWKNSGLMTHSDSQYLAARLLGDPVMGSMIAKVVRGRFPFVLLDESQDTTFFEAEALAILLNSDDVAGLVVGDPDQGIYQFAGAQPEVFYERLLASGRAIEKTLEETHRCPDAVCAVAEALSMSGAAVKPVEGASKGSCTMLVYGEGSVPWLRDQIASVSAGPLDTAVIGRSKSILGIVQSPEIVTVNTGSVAANRMFQAVGLLGAGDGRRARQIAQSTVAGCVLDVSYVTQAVLESKGIGTRKWRTLVNGAMLRLYRVAVAGCTHGEWVDSVKGECIGVAEALGLPSAAIPARLRKIGATSATPMPPTGRRDTTQISEIATVGTVHSVKGREYATLVLLAPTGSALGRDWFADRGANAEEVRIAFVAVTRSSASLVLAVDAPAYDSLCERNPEFVGLFEVLVAPKADTREAASGRTSGVVL